MKISRGWDPLSLLDPKVRALKSQSSVRTSGWTHGPCPCRLAGRSGLVVRPTDDRWSAFSSLACAGWRRALLLGRHAPRQKWRASAMSEVGVMRHAQCELARAGVRRRRRSPALVLSATRGAGAAVIRIYDSPRDWTTDRVSGRSLSRPARWGSLGLTDGRGRVRTSIPCSLRCHGTDGRQRGSSVLPPASPPVRPSSLRVLLAAVRTRLAARTRPYGFLLHVCTVCMFYAPRRSSERSIDRPYSVLEFKSLTIECLTLMQGLVMSSEFSTGFCSHPICLAPRW